MRRRFSPRFTASRAAGEHRRACHAREDTAVYDGAAVTASIDASLAALQTTYLDLLQIHWPGNVGFQGTVQDGWAGAAAGVVAALEAAVACGKLKHYGLCNFGTEDMAVFKAAGGKPVRPPSSFPPRHLSAWGSGGGEGIF